MDSHFIERVFTSSYWYHAILSLLVPIILLLLFILALAWRNDSESVISLIACAVSIILFSIGAKYVLIPSNAKKDPRLKCSRIPNYILSPTAPKPKAKAVGACLAAVSSFLVLILIATITRKAIASVKVMSPHPARISNISPTKTLRRTSSKLNLGNN